MNSYLTGIGSATVFAKGKFFEPGSYDLTVVRVMTRESQDPQKPGVWFIAEFQIDTSTNVEYPAGSTASWALNLIKHMSKGNIKELCLGLAGLKSDSKEIDACVDAAVLRAVGAENAFAGMKVHLEAYDRATKVGGQFTVHSWSGGTSKDAIVALGKGAPLAPAGLPPGYTRLSLEWIVGPNGVPVRG